MGIIRTESIMYSEIYIFAPKMLLHLFNAEDMSCAGETRAGSFCSGPVKTKSSAFHLLLCAVMARPNKKGLDYFPLDIDFFDDEKITAVSGEFGIKGEITVIRLLCAIYRNGYFVQWNDLLKYKLLKNLPGVSEQLLECIVRRLVMWGFFDGDLFDTAGVLTSRGIQRRYFNITRRRVADRTELPYLLISAYRNPGKDPGSGFLHTETPLHDGFLHTETLQSKVKESKEEKKEIKKEKKSDRCYGKRTDNTAGHHVGRGESAEECDYPSSL